MMKKAIVLVGVLFFSITSYAQETEFTTSKNGLIYSDTTIKQLKHIVDSLNLKFKVCDLNKVYRAKAQAKAHHLHLDKGNIKEAVKDIKANISFDDFVRKYNKAIVDKEVLVTSYEYINYEEKEIIEFQSIGLNDNEHELRFDKKTGNYTTLQKNKWLYEYESKSKYSSESIDAFYFLEDFVEQPIPIEYARMIQYSDCMVDTSAQIFYESKDESDDPYTSHASTNVTEFMEYINKATHKPEYDYNAGKGKPEAVRDSLYDIHWKNYNRWDSLRTQKVDSVKSVDKKFMRLFHGAEAEALVTGGGNDDFEEYVALYSSKKNALEMKRHRVVYGQCSQDRSPRIHAMNIAVLSAETVNWEIFLRAHLDIMNDNFQRASDGSYAWKGRKTYIKELEVLDINVIDLLLGISLRIENPSNNHYYGSISRIGRALAETEQPQEVEEKMLQMISNAQLDNFNRILIYYLFLNYNHNLEDEKRQTANNLKLEATAKTLPAYLYAQHVAAKNKK